MSWVSLSLKNRCKFGPKVVNTLARREIAEGRRESDNEGTPRETPVRRDAWEKCCFFWHTYVWAAEGCPRTVRDAVGVRTRTQHVSLAHTHARAIRSSAAALISIERTKANATIRSIGELASTDWPTGRIQSGCWCYLLVNRRSLACLRHGHTHTLTQTSLSAKSLSRVVRDRGRSPASPILKTHGWRGRHTAVAAIARVRPRLSFWSTHRAQSALLVTLANAYALARTRRTYCRRYATTPATWEPRLSGDAPQACQPTHN